MTTPTTEVERDHHQEAEVGRRLVRGASLTRAWKRLADFADERAHPGAILLWLGRSMVRELREEVADARNYAVWGARIGEIPADKASQICAHLAQVARILDGIDARKGALDRPPLPATKGPEGPATHRTRGRVAGPSSFLLALRGQECQRLRPKRLLEMAKVPSGPG